MSRLNRIEDKFKDLTEYLKYRRFTMTIAIVINIIYLMLYLIFSIQIETIIYGVCLTIAALIIFGIKDYNKYKQKLTQIRNRQLQITLHGIEKEINILLEDAQKKILHNRRVAINQLHELEEFYTIWAHQIKTPIAAMHLVLEEMEGEEKEILQAEIFRIEEYVQMMMAYLRLGKDSSDYLFKMTNIDEIMRESIRKYATLFIRKKIKLDFKAGVHEIVTDAKWISLLFDQLLSNAIKYTNEGSIEIYWEDKDTIVIKDSGIGIPKEDLPRVTELGFTGYNGRINKKSTGIGLYLSKRIVKNLGARLNIKSKVGLGTKVSVKF